MKKVTRKRLAANAVADWFKTRSFFFFYFFLLRSQFIFGDPFMTAVASGDAVGVDVDVDADADDGIVYSM